MLLKPRCSHRWVKDEEVKRYFDTYGILIIVNQCHCAYCDKKRKIKYISNRVTELYERRKDERTVR